MASRIGFAALALLLAVAAPAMAANFDVGGSSGWTTGVGYDSWVAGNTFSAGDTLTFTYDPTSHTVVRLATKDEYDNCATTNALKTDSVSPTQVTLDKAGTTYYFVCGTPIHCANGMKLSLTTAGGGGGGSTPSTPTTPATPSTPSTPSATPSTPSDTPSPPTTTTPAPKSAAPATTVTGTAAAAFAGVLAAALLA